MRAAFLSYILFLMMVFTSIDLKGQSLSLNTLKIPNKYLSDIHFKLNAIKYDNGVFYFFDGKSRMLKYDLASGTFDSIPLHFNAPGNYLNYQWEVTGGRFFFFNSSSYILSAFSIGGDFLYSFRFGLKYGSKKYIYYPGWDTRKNTFTADTHGNFYFPILEEFYFNRKKPDNNIPLIGKMDNNGRFTLIFGKSDPVYSRNGLIRAFDIVSFYNDKTDSLIYVSQPLSDSIQVYTLAGELLSIFGKRGAYMLSGPEEIAEKDLPNGEDSTYNKLKIESSYYAGVYTTKDFVFRMYYTAGTDSSGRMSASITNKPLVKLKKKKNVCISDPVKIANQVKILMQRDCYLQVYSKKTKEIVVDMLIDLKFFWFHGSNGNTVYLTGNRKNTDPNVITIYTINLELIR